MNSTVKNAEAGVTQTNDKARAIAVPDKAKVTLSVRHGWLRDPHAMTISLCANW